MTEDIMLRKLLALFIIGTIALFVIAFPSSYKDKRIANQLEDELFVVSSKLKEVRSELQHLIVEKIRTPEEKRFAIISKQKILVSYFKNLKKKQNTLIKSGAKSDVFVRY